MRDTPETDAFIVQNTTNEGPTGVKWRSHAERLECERDEARELADSYRIAFCSANGIDKAPNPFPWEVAK
jgi:hypothetical protein